MGSLLPHNVWVLPLGRTTLRNLQSLQPSPSHLMGRCGHSQLRITHNAQGTLETIEVQPAGQGGRCVCWCDQLTNLPSTCSAQLHVYSAMAGLTWSILHQLQSSPSQESLVHPASQTCHLETGVTRITLCRTVLELEQPQQQPWLI